MNSIKSLMIGNKQKDAIKLDIIMLNKSKTYPGENIILGDGLYRHLYQPGEQHGDKKKGC